MIFKETKLKGAFIIDLDKKKDNRGFFARTFCANEFKEKGLQTHFVQGNMSQALKKHTLRGMHYQTDGAEEVKLIRCTVGKIVDVIIDLRENSKTYGEYIAVELSQENSRQIYVPKGFAHGFLTLTKNSEISYLVSEFYSPGKEKGIRWNDPYFKIDWPSKDPFLSQKDADYKNFENR
jgi:dTDP-4-dehydrorhamnose 3,5-epimerase